MPGPNTTNTPDTDDYVFGRGECYAALLDDDDEPSTGWIHLGNCPDFSQNLTKEEFQHFSSMDDLKRVDATVLVSLIAKLSITLEEFNFFNFRQYLKGDEATITNPAVAGFAEINQAHEDVVLGRWYDITTSAGVPAYDIDPAKLTLEKDAGPDVALVLDTDYELDTIWGRFRLLPTAVNIAAGDDVNVTLAADAGAAPTIYRIQGLTTTGQRYAIKFIFKNAKNGGKQLKIEYHKVLLEPTGDLGLIQEGTTLAQMKFEATAEASTAARYAASPTVDVDWHANAVPA